MLDYFDLPDKEKQEILTSSGKEAKKSQDKLLKEAEALLNSQPLPTTRKKFNTKEFVKVAKKVKRTLEEELLYKML